MANKPHVTKIDLDTKINEATFTSRVTGDGVVVAFDANFDIRVSKLPDDFHGECVQVVRVDGFTFLVGPSRPRV